MEHPVTCFLFPRYLRLFTNTLPNLNILAWENISVRHGRLQFIHTYARRHLVRCKVIYGTPCLKLFTFLNLLCFLNYIFGYLFGGRGRAGVYILHRNHFFSPPPYWKNHFFSPIFYGVRRAGGGVLGGLNRPPIAAQRKIF